MHNTQEKRNAYQRKWYAQHREYYTQRAAEQKAATRQWIDAHKKELSCRVCGENEPCCLEFHHNKGNKEFTISEAVRRGYAIARIQKEISKCVVLCSNCHKKTHAGILTELVDKPSC